MKIYVFNNYLINICKMKLKIYSTDSLTADGIKWIARQLKRPNGFSIVDQNGEKINIKKLYDEWDNARLNHIPGPTSLIIGESHNSMRVCANEKTLIPFDLFGASLQISNFADAIDNLLEDRNFS